MLPARAPRYGCIGVPSVIGAVGAVLATYWCALAFVSRRGSVLAAMMLAASTLLGVEARLAKTDAVLLCTIVLAMGALARAYLTPREAGSERLGWKLPAIFWTALAIGILIKGPVNLMIVGLAALALSILERSPRWLVALRPLQGLRLAVPHRFTLVYRDLCPCRQRVPGWRVGPRYVGQDRQRAGNSRRATGTLFFAVLRDVLPRLDSCQSCGAGGVGCASRTRSKIPPGVARALVDRVRTGRDQAAALCAAALSCHHDPFIAGAVESKVLSRGAWLVRGAVWWFIAPIVISVATVTLAIVVARDPAFPAWPFFALAMVCGLFAWLLYEPDGAELSIVRATAGAILMGIGVFSITIPWLRTVFPSVALAGILHNASCANPVAASAGYEEPSLVFLAGTATHLTDASGAADFLEGGDCRFAFIEARQERAFALRAEAIGLRYDRGPRVDPGHNTAERLPTGSASRFSHRRLRRECAERAKVIRAK